MARIEGAVAFITGGNRGLGRHLVTQLVERGARTVYAGSRDPGAVVVGPGIVPVRLDITDPEQVRAAAEQAGDTTILINNAGSSTGTSLLTGDLGQVRLEIETHYIGTLLVTRAFAPVLARAPGGGALANVLSALSWLTFPRSGAYAAAKSAEWSLTNALRLELADQGTTVTGLHVGFMDTDMIRGLDVPKVDPAGVAAQLLDGIEAGTPEVLADDTSRAVQAGLAGGVGALYPQFTQPATV
ncbi:MAG: SDR family oxidoreductase [Frankia sp.]